MTMPSSGVISFSDINTENRATAGSAVSLGGEASRIIARIPTGQISLSDLYGGSIPNLLDFQASASDTTSHSFSNLDIGPATANRRITLVFFGTQKPSGVTFRLDWNQRHAWQHSISRRFLGVVSGRQREH